MNKEQALQILKNLSDLAVQRGGVFDKVSDAAIVHTALSVIEQHMRILDTPQEAEPEPEKK